MSCGKNVVFKNVSGSASASIAGIKSADVNCVNRHKFLSFARRGPLFFLHAPALGACRAFSGRKERD